MQKRCSAGALSPAKTGTARLSRSGRALLAKGVVMSNLSDEEVVTLALALLDDVKAGAPLTKSHISRIRRQTGLSKSSATTLCEVFLREYRLPKKSHPSKLRCLWCSKPFSRERGLTLWCESCDANQQSNDTQRRRGNVRSIANVAVRRGKLIKQPCSRCDEKRAEKHHPDYSKPLLVIWLCRPCHMEEHQRIRRSVEPST